MNNEMEQVLKQVQEGTLSVEDAMLKIKSEPFVDIDYAKVDLHRRVRQGANEVIYGAGKTPEQIAGILQVMERNAQGNVLITRMSEKAAEYVSQSHALTYYPEAKHTAFCTGEMFTLAERF